MPPSRASAHDTPDDGSIPTDLLNVLSQQETRHQQAVEDLRTYFVGQVDELRRMILAGATKEEVAEKLTSIRIQVAEVKEGMGTVSIRLDKLETNVMAKIEDVARNQSEKQTSGYRAVIAIQSAILLPIIAGVILYIIQLLIQTKH